MAKKKQQWEPPVFIPIEHDGVEYLLLKVRKDATDFLIDNAMGYLVYKVPAYENWVTDDVLSNPQKLTEYIDKYEGSAQWKLTGARLPDGKFELIGLAVQANCDYWEPVLAAKQMKPDTTLILKPTQQFIINQ